MSQANAGDSSDCMGCGRDPNRVRGESRAAEAYLQLNGYGVCSRGFYKAAPPPILWPGSEGDKEQDGYKAKRLGTMGRWRGGKESQQGQRTSMPVLEHFGTYRVLCKAISRDRQFEGEAAQENDAGPTASPVTSAPLGPPLSLLQALGRV